MSKTITKTSLRGFTLIELLVVIAIIGLLSTAIMGPVQTGLKKGRDTRKISDITQIQGSLLQYAGDNNGSYPQYLALESTSISTSTLAATSSSYMQTATNMFTTSAARDRFMYVVYADAAGNIVSYHLGVALENQNASLQGDADCGTYTNGTVVPVPTTFPPITDAWGKVESGTDITTYAETPTKSCISADNGTSLYNSNAYMPSPNGGAAGNNRTSAITGAFDAKEDFGGYGTKEKSNDVCSSVLNTCIFDIVPQ